MNNLIIELASKNQTVSSTTLNIVFCNIDLY